VKEGQVDEVVRDYEVRQLKQFDESTCVTERNPTEVKGKSFYFSRIEILNTRGEHTNIFNYNEKLILIVDLSGECMWSNYSLEFRIYKDTEGFVCIGASGAYYDIYFDKNVKRVKIEIGPLNLTNGRYRVSLSVVAGIIRADTLENACSFDILDCQPFAPGREINDAVCIIEHSFSKVDIGQ
jgi:lipopolysaccharide transport system ATP-binding protein